MHRAGNTTRTPLLNTTAELKRERKSVKRTPEEDTPKSDKDHLRLPKAAEEEREREKTTVRLSRNSSE